MTSIGAGGPGAAPQDGRRGSGRRSGVQLTERDRRLLRWIGEQYCVRVDLLGVLMARHSDDRAVRAAGAVAPRLVQRRVAAWRTGGLVVSRRFLADTPSMVWLTAEGMATVGLPWRSFEPAFPTIAHRHATGVVRAYVESRGVDLAWTCERQLREGLAGGAHCPDALITSTDPTGRIWRSAVEVELSRKHRPRVERILGDSLARYDDIIYFATPEATPVVTAAAEATGAAGRVRIRPYPVPVETLAAVA
jgi:hypothetical protein